MNDFLNPSNPVSPLNPLNPASPLNPNNQKGEDSYATITITHALWYLAGAIIVAGVIGIIVRYQRVRYDRAWAIDMTDADPVLVAVAALVWPVSVVVFILLFVFSSIINTRE